MILALEKKNVKKFKKSAARKQILSSLPLLHTFFCPKKFKHQAITDKIRWHLC